MQAGEAVEGDESGQYKAEEEDGYQSLLATADCVADFFGHNKFNHEFARMVTNYI